MDPGMGSMSIPPHYSVAGFHHLGKWSLGLQAQWMRVTRIEERVNMGHVSDNDYSASEYRVRGPMGVFSTWITYSLNIEKK